MDKVTTKEGEVLLGKAVEMKEDGEVWLRVYTDKYPLGKDIEYINIAYFDIID